jgi:hypothetical protein
MATLDELQTRRAAYVAAELKILKSQEYQVGQGMNARRNRRPEIERIQQGIKELDDQIAQITNAGARRLYGIVPGCR